ncbi:MAG: hypothetical protein DI568_15200 [Sphingomonas sp.]|nr:MAG: hypothetical protein DI568_15200 [Sphingomonas sp.]
MQTLKEIAEFIADGRPFEAHHRRLRSLLSSKAIVPTIEGGAPTGSLFDNLEAARARLGVRLLEVGISSLEAAFIIARTTRDDNWAEVAADPWMWEMYVSHVRNAHGIIETYGEINELGTRQGYELPPVLKDNRYEPYDEPKTLAVTNIDLSDIFYDA